MSVSVSLMSKLRPAAALLLFTAAAAWAQPSRISAPLQNTRVFRLAGVLSQTPRQAVDAGVAPATLPIDGITLRFRPTAAQQAALEQLLRDQQDPASPDYRRWLTPEQYADRFGLSPADLDSVASWLRAEGFTIGEPARGRAWIAFHGTADQVRRTFQTEIRQFRLNGHTHYAAVSNPVLPVALENIVAGIDGLDSFPLESGAVALPEGNTSSGGHSLAPDDIATIYGLKKLYQTGIDGTGQKLVIVGQSAIDIADVRSFRSKYNLPANDPQIILNPNSSDPGTTASLGEANLDLDVSGAVARNAKIIYVYGRSAFTALSYAVDQNLAPVVSASFSFGCEASVGTSGALTYRLVAMQANAQGITWVNSSGDGGAAGCDSNSASIAQNGLGARFPASIPEVTAVGGTQFADSTGSWWASTNDANGASALSYIPEASWNGSVAGVSILGSGGGRSIFYPKPSWQTGPGVPNDGVRGVPDVSFAGAGHTPYNVITGGKAGLYYGTSASAPAFAGMLLLLNQKLVNSGLVSKPGLGNVNVILYKLAQTNPEVFHDTTAGNNAVPCVSGSPDCINGVVGYSAAAGWDFATGLGSMDFSAFANVWPTQAATDSSISFNISANPVYQLASPTSLGNSWTFTLTVAEQNGVPAKLTEFLIDGVSRAADIASLFGSADIPAHGYLDAPIGSKSLAVPLTRTFEVRGVDPGGRTWKQSLSAVFNGLPPTPVIGGVAHGASFKQTFAPGMILSVFGTDLSLSKTQAAGVVPLTSYFGGITATINGVATPFYYVSPGQVNLQIPYDTAVGAAKLTLNNGLASATYSFTVAESAPGIFANIDGMTVPYTQGARGGTYILFITGEGAVTPSIATGAAPTGAPYPAPKLNSSMTIGGVAADIKFIGIPPGLAGVTQINFAVPPTAPLGKQPVLVTIGNATSAPAYMTITQ